jgi:1-aminocyclopropane-1-carboxylate deaminase/D-cysteine desulfhydrase-like pyridoxal-dependent ACC family enzyme
MIKRTRWTLQEDKALISYIAEGRDQVSIASLLGRTISSVSGRVNVLGLTMSEIKKDYRSGRLSIDQILAMTKIRNKASLPIPLLDSQFIGSKYAHVADDLYHAVKSFRSACKLPLIDSVQTLQKLYVATNEIVQKAEEVI